MGKEWDKFNEIVNPQGAYEKKKGFKKLPRQSSAFIMEYFTPIWRECLRVLKPGAFAFIMCIPRQDCLARMIMSLEDAGFWVGFTPMFHAFAQGFPKAGNISKMVDKKLGAKRKVIGQKTCGYQVSISKKRQAEGYRPNLTRATKEVDITLPATPQAKALDGSYSYNPKPAVEICIVCQKPMVSKTYVGQALLWYEERQKVLTEIEVELKKKYNLDKIEWEK